MGDQYTGGLGSLLASQFSIGLAPHHRLLFPPRCLSPPHSLPRQQPPLPTSAQRRRMHPKDPRHAPVHPPTRLASAVPAPPPHRPPFTPPPPGSVPVTRSPHSVQQRAATAMAAATAAPMEVLRKLTNSLVMPHCPTRVRARRGPQRPGGQGGGVREGRATARAGEKRKSKGGGGGNASRVKTRRRWGSGGASTLDGNEKPRR